MELDIYNILFLRYGRENEIQIKKRYLSTLLDPASTFGFGIVIPVHKIASLENTINLIFDYSYLDWDKVNKKYEDALGIKRTTFSISINFTL